MSKLLTIWVIYKNPKDHPGKWVLRAQDVLEGGCINIHLDCFVDDSLEAVRAHVPAGLVRMTRYPDDDPAIFETWI